MDHAAEINVTTAGRSAVSLPLLPVSLAHSRMSKTGFKIYSAGVSDESIHYPWAQLMENHMINWKKKNRLTTRTQASATLPVVTCCTLFSHTWFVWLKVNLRYPPKLRKAVDKKGNMTSIIWTWSGYLKRNHRWSAKYGANQNGNTFFHHLKRYHPSDHTIILISYKASWLVLFCERR